jgi:hypothetical protein
MCCYNPYIQVITAVAGSDWLGHGSWIILTLHFMKGIYFLSKIVLNETSFLINLNSVIRGAVTCDNACIDNSKGS